MDHTSSVLGRLMSSWLYCRYELNVLTGKAGNYDELVYEDNRYVKLYSQLVNHLQHYDPGYRDYIRGKLPEKTQRSHELIKNIAKWATEVALTIELMYEGVLPPNSLAPMISAAELPYYYKRLQDYKSALWSPERSEQNRALTFFYLLASERLYQMLKEEATEMAWVAEDVEVASLQLPEWLVGLSAFWPPSEGKRIVMQYLYSLFGQKSIPGTAY